MENKPVSSHYGTVADSYYQQYEKSNLFNLDIDYPANYFRMQIMINSFIKNGSKRIIEVGVGDGTPLSNIQKAGMETWGFDITQEMVNVAKRNIEKSGGNPDQIFLADIQDPVTYAHALKNGKFDGLMAMGVMPHVANDDFVLDNMKSLVTENGTVFIEFRNKLFSLFTMNSFTHDFIINDLLRDVDLELKSKLSQHLKSILRMDLPTKRTAELGAGYDEILSKFHNPFEVEQLFRKHNFKDIKFHWYHYHPSLPMFEKDDPGKFRKEAINLEHEVSGWRGMFLCSAFIVEAKV